MVAACTLMASFLPFLSYMVPLMGLITLPVFLLCKCFFLQFITLNKLYMCQSSDKSKNRYRENREQDYQTFFVAIPGAAIKSLL